MFKLGQKRKYRRLHLKIRLEVKAASCDSGCACVLVCVRVCVRTRPAGFLSELSLAPFTASPRGAAGGAGLCARLRPGPLDLAPRGFLLHRQFSIAASWNYDLVQKIY